MKKLEKLDKYVVMPQVGFYGGFIHDGEDMILCDDHDVDEGYDFKVKQRIENNVLITDMEKRFQHRFGGEVRETSHMEVEITKGMLLVYVEGMGFTIPEYRMCLVDEAIRQYELLK